MIHAFALAAAAASLAPPAQTDTHWVVDWGEQRCTLAIRPTPDQPATLAVRTSLGENAYAEIVLADPRWRWSPLPNVGTAPVSVALEPGTVRMSGSAAGGHQASAGNFLVIRGLGRDFIDRFSESERLTVTAGRRTLADMAFSGASEAVRALGACNDDLLTSWGIDLALRASLRQRPWAEHSNPLIGSSDYPNSAIRANQSGSVVIRYMVGTEGRVSDCTVVSSSGAEALDRETCMLVQRRARYRPALDSEGRPIAVPLVLTVLWALR